METFRIPCARSYRPGLCRLLIPIFGLKSARFVGQKFSNYRFAAPADLETHLFYTEMEKSAGSPQGNWPTRGLRFRLTMKGGPRERG
jgi:hypothetical protein